MSSPTLGPIQPHRVKISEAMMLNTAWTCLNPDEGGKEDFRPVKGVTYLWALRHDGKLIVGLEEPWNHLAAFDESVHKVLLELKEVYEARKFEKDGFGGHPTLAGRFEPNGEVYNSLGQAFIAGELKWSESKSRWELSNKSGRFGRGGKDDTASLESIAATLKEAMGLFQRHAGLTLHGIASKQRSDDSWEERDVQLS